jgi:hypothetical protein
VCEANHSLPSSTLVKNMWSFVFTVPYHGLSNMNNFINVNIKTEIRACMKELNYTSLEPVNFLCCKDVYYMEFFLPCNRLEFGLYEPSHIYICFTRHWKSKSTTHHISIKISDLHIQSWISLCLSVLWTSLINNFLQCITQYKLRTRAHL